MRGSKSVAAELLGDGKPVDWIPAEEVPGIATAYKMLENPACAALVAGPDAKHASGRLLTVEYYRVLKLRVGGDEHPAGAAVRPRGASCSFRGF